LLVRLPLHGSEKPGAHAAPPFELPYTLELPQAEIDIWRQHQDLLEASHHICEKMREHADEYASFKKEITDIGADVYLTTLMKLDLGPGWNYEGGNFLVDLARTWRWTTLAVPFGASDARY
jgi:hypothetical protein